MNKEIEGVPQPKGAEPFDMFMAKIAGVKGSAEVGGYLVEGYLYKDAFYITTTTRIT